MCCQGDLCNYHCNPRYRYRHLNVITLLLSSPYIRAVRTGPQGDLAHRASPTRLALWRLLYDHIQHLTTTSSGSQTEEQGLAQEQGQGLRPVGRSNDCVDFECQWIPGHPERRDSDKSRWSYKDIGSRLLIHACMPSYPISKPDYPTFKTRWLVQYTSFSHTFDIHVDVIMS